MYKYTLLYSIKKNGFPEFYIQYIGNVPVQVLYVHIYIVCKTHMSTVGTGVYFNVTVPQDFLP